MIYANGDNGPNRESHASIIAGVKSCFAIAAVVAAFAWSANGLQFDFSSMEQGRASMVEYLRQMVPTRVSDITYDIRSARGLLPALVATLQMGIFGSVLGTALALPTSCFAARTELIPWPISSAIKLCLNMARAIPTIVYALLAISLIGLGAPAGAMAIAFGTFVTLSKLFAEALESVPVGPIEAVRAAGGNSLQIFVFAMLPQVFPSFLSNALYNLEYNFRDSFIVGIVGAGGLGFELLNDVRIYKLADAGVIIVLIIVLVNVVDYASHKVRAALV